MTAGFNAHLAKPAAPQQLLETVERLMANEAT
jgi:CheY-like chemotaxis protein